LRGSSSRRSAALPAAEARLSGALDGWEIARLRRRASAAELEGSIVLNKPCLPSQILDTVRRLLG
jgi:hypothetical protein